MALNNTLVRVLVSIIAIPLIVILCIYGKIPFLIFTLAIGLLSYWEFKFIAFKKNINLNYSIGSLSIIAIILNSYYHFVEFNLLMVIIVFAVLLVELFRNSGSAILNIGSSLLGILYLGLFASTLVFIREYYSGNAYEYSEGGYLIISIMASIWICDSAAFFLGSAFGKNKLFPRVSPNKSWEGAIAGFLFAITAMIAAKAIVLDQLSLTDAVIIGFIVGTIGQMGDLVESLIKRDAGVKDSSQIIPGHGGIFDRFDSLLFTAPAVYAYLYFLS